MHLTTALLDEEAVPVNGDQGHGAIVTMTVDYAEGFSEEELWNCLQLNRLPIYTGYPARALPEEVGDIYARFKPRQIGHFTVLEFVKVNDSWVLHGRIHYTAGHLINHAILKPLRLIVQSKDIDPNDPGAGRTLVNIIKVRTDPL